MEEDWVVVKTFDKIYLANIAEEALLDNGIKSVVINKKDSSYLSFGDIELYVHKNDFDKAQDLLADF